MWNRTRSGKLFCLCLVHVGPVLIMCLASLVGWHIFFVIPTWAQFCGYVLLLLVGWLHEGVPNFFWKRHSMCTWVIICTSMTHTFSRK